MTARRARRHDERALYGCIADSVHMPLADLLFSLPASDAAFEAIARHRKPERDRLLIMHSREHARAELAARLALENGAPQRDQPCMRRTGVPSGACVITCGDVWGTRC